MIKRATHLYLLFFCLIVGLITVGLLPWQTAWSSDQELKFFMNAGQRQYLRISTERIAVRFAPDLTPQKIDSIIDSEPRLLSAWKRTTLLENGRIICDLPVGSSESDIRELLQSLSDRPDVLSATPSYSVGDDILIPTDRLVVRFGPSVTPGDIVALISKHGAIVDKELLWLDQTFVLKLAAPGQEVITLANLLNAEPEVIFCHPDFIRLIKQLSSIPNDTHFASQWNLNNLGLGGGSIDADIDMPEAWSHARGLASVSIAVIDEGVDTTHEDLSAKIVNQYDATDQDDNQQPNSWDGHGTAVAGAAAALPNNSLGLAGVAWNCSIMPVRMAYKVSPLPVLWVTTDEIIADAIATAVIRGADVLNCSWGLSTSSDLIYAAISFAKQEGRAGRGCVIVGSAGNSDGNFILFPAAYDEVIAVGATNEWDERKSKISSDGETYWGSNYGPELDLVAPGVHIWTTDIMGSGGFNTGNSAYGDSVGNYWSRFNGTSAAVPQVAGLAALIISLDPSLTSDEVQEIMQTSADDQVGLPAEDTPGWDQYMGHGRINAYRAVKDLSRSLYVGGTMAENSTWDTSKVYLVTDDLTIPVGVTLTIEAGVVVKFDYVPLSAGVHQRNKLLVDGTLLLHGTADAPVVFTSIRDDDYGGDTEGDSSATTPSAGDWGYIKLSGSTAGLEHCLVRYAGVGWFDQSDLPPYPVTYYDKQAIWIDQAVADFSLSHCRIEWSGIFLGEETVQARAIFWEGTDLFPSTATISDNTITNGQDGIYLRGETVGSSATIERNLLSDLIGTAIEVIDFTGPIMIAQNIIQNGIRGMAGSNCQSSLAVDSNQITNQTGSAIELEFCNATISKNALEQTGALVGQGNGLYLTHGSNVLVQRNSITGFDIGLKGESGAANEPSDLNIRSNSISDNFSAGIFLTSTDIDAADGSSARINDNDLFENGGYNLYLGHYQNPDLIVIDAEDNWWGTADEADLAAAIYERDDDPNSPTADYSPFRTNSIFTPELMIEFDQALTKVSLFPDSTVTSQIMIYNYGVEGELIFSIQERAGEVPSLGARMVGELSSAADLVWLAVQPTGGVLPPGDSLMIELSFAAAGLVDSNYIGYLIIESNDPDSNPFVVPVSLEVSSLFILSPNGGERYDSGVNQLIVWELVESQLFDSVSLWFSTDGGGTYPELIGSGVIESSQFEWRVPNQPTDSARIMAEVFWTGGLYSWDASDSLFTIVVGPYYCGQYADGRTGNTNCDLDGKRNLADITQLIDRVYLTKAPLCEESEGNVNGDVAGKMNLADITRLIDHVYGTKVETAACQ